jgi:ribosomal protein S27AE/post-segregation antitoxin (ccd killing protein)
MNGIPENQTFDFAQNVSQPTLTSQERRKLLLKGYRKKWLEKPESREIIRAISRKAGVKHRANRSAKQVEAEKNYHKQWYKEHKEHILELQQIRNSNPETRKKLTIRMRAIRQNSPDFHRKELERDKQKRHCDPEYNEQRNAKTREWQKNNADHIAQKQRDYSKNNPGKVKAHHAVNHALKNGTINKPKLCERCGKEKFLHAHHADYTKPLEVIWVCVICHSAIHFP